MNITDFIPQIAEHIGIAPSQLTFYLILVSALCNMASRLIPDDTPGILGAVRKITTVIGMYVPNRITGGVTTADVAKAVVTDRVDEIKQTVSEALPDEAEEFVEKVIPAFPGLAGKIVKEAGDEKEYPVDR